MEIWMFSFRWQKNPPLPTGIKKVSVFHRENGDKGSKSKFKKKWQLPTLPLWCVVPSAVPDLTALFGMGRGGTPVRSTIGGAGLNCSVRNGKRWNTGPETASNIVTTKEKTHTIKKRFGLLVPLDCDIAAYTSAAYPRRGLRRP